MAVAVVVGGIAMLMARTKPKLDTEGRTVFRMNRPVFVVLIILCALISAGTAFGAVWYSVQGDTSQLLPIVLLSIGFGAPVPLMVTAMLTDMYDVYMDEEGITGASKVYGLGVRESRFTMPFTEMRKVGMTLLQSMYVEDARGRRIYWSQHYSGHAVLEGEIARHLPAQE